MQLIRALVILAILFQRPVKSTKNHFIFERLLCEKMPNTIASAVHCDMKNIGRDRVKIGLNLNLTEPIADMWFHFVTYYRYNGMTYQKFVIDLWENFCDWLEGKQSFILNWTLGKLLTYSNLNHSCPYDQIYVKSDNISFNIFDMEQLLPAGRYRIDISISDGYQKKALAEGQLFFSVSDHRIEMW